MKKIYFDKEEEENEEVPFLPDDIIFHEVLPRLAVADLKSALLLCKKWRLALSGGVFVDRQMMLSMPANPRFIFSSVWPSSVSSPRHFLGAEIALHAHSYTICQHNIMRLSETHNSMRIMGSCHGLLLMRKSRVLDSIYYIVNPAIQESVPLPLLPPIDDHPQRFDEVAGLVYDKIMKKFKVIIFFCCNTHFLCRILTLGSTTWRRISTPIFHSIKRLVNPGLNTEGYLHFGCYQGCRWLLEEVLTVDIHNESISLQPLPFRAASIWKYKDSVATADPTINGFHVHCMKYGAGAVVHQTWHNISVHLNWEYLYPLGSFRDGEVLIFKEYPHMKLWYYNTKLQVLSEIETPWGNNPEVTYSRFLYYEYNTTLVSPMAAAAAGGNNGDQLPAAISAE